MGEQAIPTLVFISPEKRKAYEALLGPGPRPEPRPPHQVPEAVAKARTQVEALARCAGYEAYHLAIMVVAMQEQLDELTRWVERLKGVALGEQRITTEDGMPVIRFHEYGAPEKPLCEIRWAAMDQPSEVAWLDE